MQKKERFLIKLGLFVIVGLALLVVTVYYIGKEKNLFGPTFTLKVQFKSVSGLKVGNNVRFSGINVGTINDIVLTSDSTVQVVMVIKKKIQKFIKSDAQASIGSDGLMGDKVLTIINGKSSAKLVDDNAYILCKNAVEIDDIMMSAKASVDNVGIITEQLALFTYKINNSNGLLTTLIADNEMSESIKNTLNNLQTSSNNFTAFTNKLNNGNLTKALDSTMVNIQGATKGLNENMEAAKSNFLLRGYYKKKKKAAAKKLKADSIKSKN